MGLTAAKALEGGSSEIDASFYRGKLQTMKYFFHYELVKSHGLFERLLNGDGLTVETNENHFMD